MCFRPQEAAGDMRNNDIVVPRCGSFCMIPVSEITHICETTCIN